MDIVAGSIAGDQRVLRHASLDDLEPFLIIYPSTEGNRPSGEESGRSDTPSYVRHRKLCLYSRVGPRAHL